jgi:beta-mannosidase
MLTIQPEADGLALFAINDTGETWSADISLSRRTFEDQKLVQETINCNVPMRSSVKVCTIDPTLATPEDRACEVLIAQSKRTRATWFFDRDKYLRYPAAMFNAELVADNTTYYLTITARTLLRDIMVFADRLDPNATMNEQGITLLPGEAYCFVIESDQVLTCEHLTAAPVFQCANRFGKPPSIILI